MSNLPVHMGAGGLSPRESKALSRSERRAQVAVVEHWLGAQVAVQKDQIDQMAVVDAATYSLEAEVGLLNYGKHLAGNDPAAQELVARKLSLLVGLDDARLRRRFGA